MEIDLGQQLAGRPTSKTIRAYSPWADTWTDLIAQHEVIGLPPFQQSIVLKVQ